MARPAATEVCRRVLLSFLFIFQVSNEVTESVV
jgi:hypothetical protein